MIKEAKADHAVLTMKGYEAMVEMSKGQATKLIIPSELQGLASMVAAGKEIFTDTPKQDKK